MANSWAPYANSWAPYGGMVGSPSFTLRLTVLLATGLLPLLLPVLQVGALSITPPPPRTSRLSVTVDSTTGAFNVSVGDRAAIAPNGAELWLLGQPPVLAGCSGSPTPLTLTKHSTVDGLVHPTLGEYNEVRFFWSAAANRVETAIQTFVDGETALFAQHWPDGLPSCGAGGARSGELLAFPLFGAGGREQQLGALTWNGAFSQHSLSSLSGLTSAKVSRANGGPVLVIGEQQSFRSLVVSPFENFLSASQSTTTGPPPPTPPPPPGPKWVCSAGCTQVKEQTDVTGNPKVDLGHKDNLTRAECCALCSAHGKACEAWARVPGERTTCWVVGGVTGFAPSSEREVGCPSRFEPGASHSPLYNNSDGHSNGESTSSWQWSVGISSQVLELPSGFNHSTVLRVGNGVTGTLQSWGHSMRTAYNTTRNPDKALSHLSYWTDNGAYYYMYGAKNPVCDQLAHGRIDQLLLQLIQSWKTFQLPVRTIQLDDWWYVGGERASHDHMCVKELSPKPTLFPNGLPSLPKEITYHLYGPFFCEDNIYAAETNITFVNSTLEKEHDADPATFESSRQLYATIFSHHHAEGVPMSNFEVDFLQDQTQWFGPFVEKLHGSKGWLDGMADAAAANNISVQYCMSHPAAFLNALSLPAVTNGRASGDYQTPTGNLLQYGANAPFFAAVGIAPSKDNWQSIANQPCRRSQSPDGVPACDGGSRNASDNFLHALVATLSTGPVGFSDALGYNNVSLIQATCASDGLLLKPSLPLAAIDRSFCRSNATCGDHGRPSLPPHAQIWATHTATAGNVWYYALAIAEMSGSLNGANLLRTDLYPPLSLGADVVVWEHRDPAASATLVKGIKRGGTGEQTGVLTAMNPLDKSDGEYKYVVVSPVLSDSGGWAFLGEVGKLTPVSVQRGWMFDLAEGFLVKLTAGTPGENVTVAAWKDNVVHTHSIIADDRGEGAAIFE